MKKTLIIMAAGMGSRYGGSKQVTGFGPSGEWLCEYSAYDAMRAGFDKVVLVIKPDMLDLVKEKISGHMDAHIESACAFQSFSALPSFYRVPEGRVKPFGTVHATLCAAPHVDGPFAVLNADDFYGRDAFERMSTCLDRLAPEGEVAMVGYPLAKTLSEFGTVTRAVCRMEGGDVTALKETKRIGLRDDGRVADMDSGEALDPDALVSMNFWGCTPWMMHAMRAAFDAFLRELPPDELKAELLLPVFIDRYMRKGDFRVLATRTDAEWFGVTNPEDKPRVIQLLKDLHDRGEYPTPLW